MTTEFKGTKISVNFLFALTLAVISLFDKSGEILFCLIFAFLHELGHLSVLLLSKEKPKRIVFTPFGIRIERNENKRLNYKTEALCAFMGPAVNIFFAVIFFILENKKLFSVNLALSFLNLLPCEPLDGGKILENLLLFNFSEEKTDKIIIAVSCITVFPVAILGFLVLLKSRYNFSLLLISLYLIFFIAMKAKK